MPTMPNTPDSTGGAGSGSRIHLNSMPTRMPATSASSASFIGPIPPSSVPSFRLQPFDQRPLPFPHAQPRAGIDDGFADLAGRVRIGHGFRHLFPSGQVGKHVGVAPPRSEEHTSELQSRDTLV